MSEKKPVEGGLSAGGGRILVKKEKQSILGGWPERVTNPSCEE